MQNITKVARRLFIFILTLGFPLAATAKASDAPVPVLQPQTAVSPSGQFELRIVPSDRHGAGPATYVLKRDGETVFAGKKPMTLWKAVVSDSGTFGGFAYTTGPWLAREAGDLAIAMFDAGGETLLDHRLARTLSNQLHTPPFPMAGGVTLQPAWNQMLVEVADKLYDDPSGTLQRFDLDTGRRLEPMSIAMLAKGTEHAHSICAMAAVPQTPLLLVHWYLVEQHEDYTSTVGDAFALIDEKGKTVWTLRRPGSLEDDGETDWTLRDQITGGLGIIEASDAERFTIWSPATAEAVEFAVERADETWQVKQVARRPHQLAGELNDFQTVELEHLGTIELKPGHAAAGKVVRDICAFDIDDRGRFGFIRSESAGTEQQRATFVLADPTDEAGAICEVAPDGFGDRLVKETFLTWIGGDRWLIADSPLRDQGSARAWAIDAATGEITPLEQFDQPDVQALAGHNDGTFAALIEVGGNERLVGFDAAGRERWRVVSEAHHPTRFFAGNAIAAGPNGTVAVLSNIVDDIRVYDRDGKHVSTLDLKQIIARELSYPTHLDASGNGWAVFDFDTDRPLLSVSAEGKLLSDRALAFASGHEIRSTRSLVVDQHGKAWVSDRDVFARIDENGQVDRIVGQLPIDTELNWIADLAVSADGAVYALDAQTGACHVFDEDGTLRRTMLPAVEVTNEVGKLHGFDRVTVRPDGHVLLGSRSDNRVAEFDEGGEFVGVKAFAPASVYGAWILPTRGGERHWIVGFESLLESNRDGEIVRRLDRGAEDRWLNRGLTAAVSPDDSLAVLSPESYLGGGGGPGGFHFFTADGTPERFVPCPGKHFADYDGTWAVAPVDQSVYLVHRESGKVLRFTPELQNDAQPYFRPLIPAAGELWLHAAGTTRIERYRLPD